MWKPRYGWRGLALSFAFYTLVPVAVILAGLSIPFIDCYTEWRYRYLTWRESRK